MLRYSICAFLAPAVVSAAAFPWAGPEPTFLIPAEDNWSPAPTLAPGLEPMELFRRDDAGDNTCGYISGISSSSLTCNDNSYVCATNSYYGVHGCCDPNSISSCSIPTTCIPSSLMSSLCTSDCSTNDYIAKCTLAAEPYCYQWRYVYSSRTVMTEFGCAASAFTISVDRTYDGEGASTTLPSEAQITVTVTASASQESSSVDSSASSATAQSETASPTATTTTSSTKKSSSHVGAIVGGVIGGLVVIGAIVAGIIFLLMRKRKQKQNATNAAGGATAPMMGGASQGPAPGVTEYKPQGVQSYPSPGQQYADPATAGYYGGNEQKPGFAQLGVPGQEMTHPYSPPGSPAPQYSGPAPVQPVPFGIAEAGGSPVQQQPGTVPQHHPQGQPGTAPPPPQQQQQQHQIYEAPA